MRPLTSALLTSGGFAVFSSVYISWSDAVANQIAIDHAHYQALQSVKGILFMVTVSVGLFLLTYGFLRRLERKNRESQQAREAILLMERQVLAGTLAASIVHDVRNLTGAIRGNLEYVQQVHQPEGDVSEAIADSVDAIDQLTGLNDRLRDAARAHIAEERVELDLGELVSTAVALIATHEKLEHCHLKLDLGDTVPAPVFGNLVTHAVINLVLNAAEATGQGGTIKVRLEHARDRARLIVEDDGPGIPAHEREAVLQPFATGTEDGTGLGLFSVAYCMDEHGGELKVDESPLGGARVELCFSR